MLKFAHGLCLMVLALCLGGNLYAQEGSGNGRKKSAEKAEISGQILDQNGVVVPYAGVLLFRQKDSTLKDGASSDEDGKFRLSAKPGNYYLKVRFLSYKEKQINDLVLTSAGLRLGKVEIEPSENQLETVSVEAERPEMELKLDKRVFNVQQDISNAGQNAADILDNIPSITVDAEGNVSLRGSGNVRLLIDGRPSALLGMNGKDALRQIQGDMIERVEVITNPSARYDAEGEVGIINIVLKKRIKNGFNGSVNARAGYPENFGGGANLNYRYNWFNVFGGYGIGYRQQVGGGAQIQNYDGPDTTYSFDQETNHQRGGLSHNIRGGFDFHLSKSTTLTLSAAYNKSNGDNTGNIVYNDYDLNEVLTRMVDRNEIETDHEDNQDYTLSFRQIFKKPEQVFTFSINKNINKEGESSDLSELSSNPADASIYQRTSSDESFDNWLIQADYIHPFLTEGKFETGFRISLKEHENDFQKEDSLVTGWEIDDLFDNHLLYNENIYAGYIMAGNKTGPFSYQAGLRAEYSDVTTNLIQTNEVNNRTYFNLFPSAHLAYELKKENFIQLSYSRRISRPGSFHLSPFFTFIDSRNFFAGNPNVDPEYTHSTELGHLKYWEKGSILTSLYYRYTTDNRERILFIDSLGFTRRIPINIGWSQAFGVEFSSSYELFEWWEMTGNFNFYREMSDGNYEGVQYKNDTYAFSGRARSKFKIGRKFSAQLSFNYRSPAATSQGSRQARYDLGATAAVEILKGNGTLSFNVRDIFNTRIRRSIVETEYFYSESEFQWRSRTMTLNFVYRINQKKEYGRSGGGFDGGFDGGE